MGDACDMADIERFARSDEGREYLDRIRIQLRGRCIVEVSFNNEVHCLSTRLQLDDGSVFDAVQAGHEVDALRESFGEAIEREYYKEYPQRKPYPKEKGDERVGEL